MAADFVHLHNHSEYSLLDGANRVKNLVRLAEQHEMPAVALTDHGVMHGAVEFALACDKAGVKPIIGCELYTSGDRPRTGRDPKLDKENYHLLALAQNETGYKNLVKLVSQANIDGFYYKPRVDHELLAQHSEGLIVTSACLGSEISQALLANQYETARNIAAKYRDIFTAERYFIEIQDHGQKEDREVNPQLLRIADELGLRTIVTNDIHYGAQSDANPHDVLLCIGTGSKVSDEKRLKYPSDQFYFKNADEMRRLFPDNPDALNNTVAIAEMVDFQMKTGDMILPHYEVPEGHTYDSYFEACCWEGAKKRYPAMTPDQKARIEYEMHVIEVKGYSAYFLIVADFVRWAHGHGIPARCRGSAAGSVVSYLLGITNVDPLEYGLLFERFLYMERITPPDIDLDFADYRREDVIQYCREKYGPDHVAQIITFGTLGARAAIRDVARAMDLPLAEADKIAKLIPQHPGRHFSIEGCLKDVPELARKYKEEPETKAVLDAARGIEGLSRHSSVHAAAVVITPGPVTDFCPVQKSETGLITQFDMGAVSSIGLLKMDFLGLSTLTVVERCVEMIKANHPDRIPPDFDIDNIPKDDPAVFKLLQSGNCAGAFQLESSGMRSLVLDIKPTRFEDLIPLVALYRPGPLGNGDTERFIRRRHGQEKVTYLHKSLEPILKDTYGIFVYQEQIMKVAMEVAGMGSQDADTVLRSLSKKKMEQMQAMRPKFVAGAKEKSSVPVKVSEEIFDTMASFAAYGFGLNHSGAYAVLTYQTAWLKANFPTEFMAAMYTSLADNKEKLASYIDDGRQMDPPITVTGPDVNHSAADFSVDTADPERRTVRFGLTAIKGIGDGPVGAIIEARNDGGHFSDIWDFCERVDIARCQKSAIEAIIKAGGFDSLYSNRAATLAALENAFATAQRARKEKESGQAALFDALMVAENTPAPRPPLPAIPEFDRAEKLALEKELLGLYLSGHPFLAFKDRAAKFSAVNSEELRDLPDKQDVVVAGLVAGLRKVITRSSKAEMCIVTLEDVQGKLNVTLFPRTWEKYRDDIAADMPVVVRGKVNYRERVRATEEGDSVDVEVLGDEILILSDNNQASFRYGNGNGKANGNGVRRYNRLRLDLTDATSATAGSIKTLLRHYPGDNPVIVQKRGHQVKSILTVAATDEVRQEVARLLGTSAVTLE